ncbi:MAG: hypothetical protein RHS_5464 [Robinsoniella sp. RHS]|nr:MAG: hypothetical protein RHS_5464 [Robinsoniella sp. RHS]
MNLFKQEKLLAGAGSFFEVHIDWRIQLLNNFIFIALTRYFIMI